jgi:hypothetical protein
MDPEQRMDAWVLVQDVHPDGDELALAVAKVDPNGPPPEAEQSGPRRPATIADLRKVMAETRWTWEPWIPSSSLFGIAAFEGVGKTRFALDLAARVYFKRPWPDGQPATLPEGTRTLWLCSDGQHDELAETAKAFGLPDDAVAFCTTTDEIYGNTSVDEAETLALLNEFLGSERFGLAFLDTLTNATARNLSSQQDVKIVGSPLRDLAKRHQTPIGPLLHLARDGGVLGRRIRGLTRTLIQLEASNPGQPERLRVWVEKSWGKKPPPLGATMSESGNTYDHTPPEAPESSKTGRPSKSRDEAVEFIRNALAGSNDRRASALCAEWEQSGKAKTAFWRARDLLRDQGKLICEGEPLILHLIQEEASAPADEEQDGPVVPHPETPVS